MNLLKDRDLRKRILYTLGMLFVFRIGSALTIPYVNAGKVTSSNGILDIMNMIGGGNLQHFSLFALGVSPFITAQIVVELLSMDVIKTLSDWKKEGNAGKKKKDKVTAALTIFLAVIQGLSMVYLFDKQYGILETSSVFVYIFVVTVMTAGSMLTTWIGNMITINGISNGTSLLIFTGIVANLPQQIMKAYDAIVTYDPKKMAGTIGMFALFIISLLAIVVFVVFTDNAVRKIKVNYATNSKTIVHSKEGSVLPLKINSANVLPVIFAASIMSFPRTVISFMKSTKITRTISDVMNYQKPVGFIIYIVLIILFTFFYANLQIDAKKISEDFQRSGAAIPNVRQGKDTKKYIGTVLNRISVAGSFFLAVTASVPMIIPIIWPQVGTSMSISGTGIIIMSGVALETVRQLKAFNTRISYTSMF